jgi:nucleoside-diphosphate-sugar epimerase
MRTAVIGGTGHIGTYLVPMLVRAGHEVVVVSRGQRAPYQPDEAWRHAEIVTVDRDAEDAAGTFGPRVRDLGAEVVVDLICFTEPSARHLLDALRGQVGHLLHCGTIWVHGPSGVVPTREDTPRRPFGEYGVGKAAIERLLLGQDDVPVTVIHPGHISGPGWSPVNPAGHLGLAVFEKLAAGTELALPNLGMETVQHVHARDVAAEFVAAVDNRSVAAGQSFHAVAEGAMTLRGYAEGVAESFGREANLVFLSWDQWRETVTPRDAEITWDHIAHSPHCSMEKAARVLGFSPAHSPLEAVLDAIGWLAENGRIRVTP